MKSGNAESSWKNMKWIINEYNKLNSDKQKPYILLAIDEVAMLQDEKECMTTIEKYRQLVGH